MMLQNDLNIVRKIVEPLLGRKAWGASLGHGSFITVEFGVQPIDDRKRSEWHLWVYCCAWYISDEGTLLAACEDHAEKMRTAIELINGLTLTNIELILPGLETKFHFGDRLALHTFPMYTDDNDAEQWMLFTPDDKVLVIGPSNNWAYESAFSR